MVNGQQLGPQEKQYLTVCSLRFFRFDRQTAYLSADENPLSAEVVKEIGLRPSSFQICHKTGNEMV